MLKSSYTRIWISSFICGLGILACFILFPRQPRYNGKTLNQWLEQLGPGLRHHYTIGRPLQESFSDEQKEAAEAVRHIGIQALPRLRRDLERTNNSLNENLALFINETTPFRIMDNSYTRKPRAIYGLVALGPDAKAAIPDLIKAQRDSELSNEASMALASIGPEGCQILVNELTNATSANRDSVLLAAVCYHIDSPIVINQLMTEVTNHTTRSPTWMLALANWGNDGKMIIPLLEKELQSTNAEYRFWAADGLSRYGSEAKSARSLLTEALHDRDERVRNCAQNALKRIDQKN